jgi:hypothetical protein
MQVAGKKNPGELQPGLGDEQPFQICSYPKTRSLAVLLIKIEDSWAPDLSFWFLVVKRRRSCCLRDVGSVELIAHFTFLNGV